MDPCPFVRIVVGSLALKFPAESKLPPTFDCKIKLKGFSTQSTSIPAFVQDREAILDNRIHACFNFSKSELVKFVEKSNVRGKPSCLNIEIYGGKVGFGYGSKKLLGSVLVTLDLKSLENIGHRGFVIQNGWVSVSGSTAELNLNVRAEPDPRFVFQFDGEPECSPQVFQVNGNVKQPVFTCKFSFRNAGDRNLRSRFVYPVFNQSICFYFLVLEKGYLINLLFITDRHYRNQAHQQAVLVLARLIKRHL